MTTAHEVFDMVYKVYASFDADNAHARQQLAAIKTHVNEWFHSAPRFISKIAEYCINRLVVEHLCHKPNLTDIPEALASLQREIFIGRRHSKLLSARSGAELDHLSRLLHGHVICGYLFGEFGYGYTERLSTRPAEELYEIWSPLILSRVMARCDPKSKDEEDIQRIWAYATGQPIMDLLRHWGVLWEPSDSLILTRYFYAGRLLRWFESLKLTDDEVQQFYAAGF